MVVPVGCLSFVILFIGLIIGELFLGFNKVISDSDVTKHAINIINQNPEDQQKLGTNIKRMECLRKYFNHKRY